MLTTKQNSTIKPRETAFARVVDLCCGMGGLSAAAREMGMRVVAGARRPVFGYR